MRKLILVVIAGIICSFLTAPVRAADNMPTGEVIFSSAAGFTSGCTILTALPTSGNAPLNVDFIAQAFDTKGAIQMYEFDFGDGSGGQLKIIRQKSSMATHRYNNAGSYTATVRAQDSQGKWLTSLDCQKLINVGGKTLGATAAPATTTLPKTGVSDVVPLAITISAIVGYRLFKRSARDINF